MKGVLLAKWLRRMPASGQLSVVVASTLKDRLAVVLQLLRLAAETGGCHAESIHKLRVSSRRAAVSLGLYRDLLPRRRQLWLKKWLKRIRRAANDPRDCDVIIERLGNEQCCAWSRRWLEEVCVERETTQHAIVRVYEQLRNGRRFARQTDRLVRRVRWLGKDNPVAGRARYGHWALKRLRPMVDQFFKAAPADRCDEIALHDFRIRCKKLRYAIELVAGALPDECGGRLYATITATQRRLGDINNLAVATARLQCKLTDATGPVEADAWGRLLTAEQRLLTEARYSFWDWFTPEILQELREGFETMLRHSGQPASVGTVAFG
jgi:CHAD domain-containing protein